MFKTIILFLFIYSPMAKAMIIFDEDQKGRPVIRTAGVNADAKTRVRFIGTHDFTITGNQTAQSDWTIPQLQFEGNNVESIMSGVNFKVVGGCDGDKVKFQVVHPQAGVLDEFATDFYVYKNEIADIKEHRASIPSGLIIRVVYTSTCSDSARFIMNLRRYIEVE